MERGSRNDAVDGIKMVGMGNLGTGEESTDNQESKDVLLALFLALFSLELVLSKPFLARAGSQKSIAGANWKLTKQGSRARTDACDKEVLGREKAAALHACELESGCVGMRGRIWWQASYLFCGNLLYV